jgi:hypothetical protein
MINFTKESIEEIVLTLTESATLTNPNFLFRFVNRTTRREIAFVKLATDDTSPNKDRFNEFQFVVDDYFGNEDPGEWTYLIYEQTSPTNTDWEMAGTCLETGIMRLNASSNFGYIQHNPNNEYITR